MLADAFRAENYRFWKNRTAVLWSVAFVPVMAIVFGALGSFVLKANAEKLTAGPNAAPELRTMVSSDPLNLGDALLSAAAQLASPPLLLFVLIGAATVYAGDYRWETWRLISARNSRPNLLLGKVAVVGLLGLIAMAAMLIASQIDAAVRGAVFQRSLGFSMTGAQAGDVAILAGLSWMRLMQFTLMALLAATVTRSLLAALFVPLVAGIGGFFAPNLMAQMGIGPDAWLTILLNPGGAFETIAGAVTADPTAAVLSGDLLLKAWVSAGAWTLLPLAGALAWFRRQDLSKE